MQPKATKYQALEARGREAECASVPNDEVWEVVSPGLDRLLGRFVIEVESIVRHGAMGVEGFCQYLTYLIEENGIKGGLNERKVKILINNMYVLILFREIIRYSLGWIKFIESKLTAFFWCGAARNEPRHIARLSNR